MAVLSCWDWVCWLYRAAETESTGCTELLGLDQLTVLSCWDWVCWLLSLRRSSGCGLELSVDVGIWL